MNSGSEIMLDKVLNPKLKRSEREKKALVKCGTDDENHLSSGSMVQRFHDRQLGRASSRLLGGIDLTLRHV